MGKETTERPAWLIVGLGNPGAAYAGTRHNVGFRVVAVLAGAAGVAFAGPAGGALWARAPVGGELAMLLQPQAFMNASGPPVAAWLEALGLPAERLLVVADDLDLEVGRVKVAGAGGDGGHRGLRSIAEAVGTAGFLRMRVGIGRPAGEDAAAYVLKPPGPGEAEALGAAETRAAEAVRAVMADGPAAAMNRFNPWPPSPAPWNPRPETPDSEPPGGGDPRAAI